MFLQKEAFTTAWGKRVMVLTSTHHRTKHIYWNKSGRENLYFIFYVHKLELADAEVIMTLLHGMKWSGELDYQVGRSSGSEEQLGCFYGSSSWLQPLSVARLRSSAARDGCALMWV